MNPVTQEIAATAARIVVEEGLEYGPAKRRAVKQLGLPSRAELPGNDAIEEAVFEYLSVFCADTQPAELRALREPIGLHLTILDADDLRGALKPDARGRTERGDLAALRRLLTETPEPKP